MRERYSQEGGAQQNLLDEKSARYTKMKHDDDIENLRFFEDLVKFTFFIQLADV